MKEVLEFLTRVEVVAWFGAITGSLSLIWKIYSHKQERSGKIKISAKVDEANSEIRNVIILTLTNVGYEERNIIFVGYKIIIKSSSGFNYISSFFKKSKYIKVIPTHINGKHFRYFESQDPSIKQNLIRGASWEYSFVISSSEEIRTLKVMAEDTFGKKYYSNRIQLQSLKF